MDVQQILSRFENVKPQGERQWSAKCPAHHDRHNSLSVGATVDGTKLFKCHAGCETSNILMEAGLSLGDLFPNSLNGNGKPHIVAEYDYRDESGKLLFQVVRMEPKTFRQRRPDGSGGFVWNTKGTRKVLYRLPELLAADPSQTVFVVEGEKDCDFLLSKNLVATCNPGGAGKWREEYNEHLRGRQVCIIPDNDQVGRQHAQHVAQSLHGTAASVKIAYMCNLPEHGDVSDWLSDGPASLLADLADDAPEWEPSPEEQSEPDKEVEPRFTFLTAPEFAAMDYRCEYHIPGVLAAGGIPTLLCGAFKTLKTSIMMDLAVSLAMALRFLGHFEVPKKRNVAIMSGESGGFALQNLARRVAISKGTALTEMDEHFRIATALPNLTIKSDILFLQRFIEENAIELLALDPVYLAMRGLQADAAGNIFSMAGLLEPLARLAEKTGCVVMLVHHNRKMQADPSAPPELSDIAWSGFAEWAGQWILLSRRERYEADSDGEHKLWMNAGGRDGHSQLIGIDVIEGRADSPEGRRWDLEVMKASKARVSAGEAMEERKAERRDAKLAKQLEQDKNAVHRAFQKLGKPETKTAIRDLSGINSTRFDVALAELLNENIVEPCEIMKGNNRIYDGFKLQPDATGRNGTASGQNPVPVQLHQEQDNPL